MSKYIKLDVTTYKLKHTTSVPVNKAYKISQKSKNTKFEQILEESISIYDIDKYIMQYILLQIYSY
jgi:hypothetical protein